MSFYGHKFIFNGISCENYDLMVYDVGGGGESDSPFAGVVTINDEVIGSKWKPYFYGVTYEEKLEHEITFGVNTDRIAAGRYLNRAEIDDIATWLTGHDKYLVLEIEQDDMTWVRYKCIVTQLSVVSYSGVPYTFRATFTCDSPYAYEYPRQFVYTVVGSKTVTIFNDSCLHGYYYPVVEIVNPGASVTIENMSDNNRVFSIDDIPEAVHKITVNNDRKVITNDQGLNLYPGCNYKFFRMVKGTNKIRITGNCMIRIICEFPVNAGA